MNGSFRTVVFFFLPFPPVFFPPAIPLITGTELVRSFRHRGRSSFGPFFPFPLQIHDCASIAWTQRASFFFNFGGDSFLTPVIPLVHGFPRIGSHLFPRPMSEDLWFFFFPFPVLLCLSVWIYRFGTPVFRGARQLFFLLQLNSYFAELPFWSFFLPLMSFFPIPERWIGCGILGPWARDGGNGLILSSPLSVGAGTGPRFRVLLFMKASLFFSRWALFFWWDLTTN